MTCQSCDQFDTNVPIRSPGEFARIAGKVRAAVSEGSLVYNSLESDRELIGQPSFQNLDLLAPLPDAMRYHFNCAVCGKAFGLEVETYHGRGGQWSTLGNRDTGSVAKA
jgi:hypothetical protein